VEGEVIVHGCKGDSVEGGHPNQKVFAKRLLMLCPHFGGVIQRSKNGCTRVFGEKCVFQRKMEVWDFEIYMLST
jgi:hypothetical protein